MHYEYLDNLKMLLCIRISILSFPGAGITYLPNRIYLMLK
jgi:hypothetical protein